MSGRDQEAMPGLGYVKLLDRLTDKGKGKAAAMAQNYAELFNSLKVCLVAMSVFDVPVLLKWTNLVTGWDMSAEEFLRVGERNLNVKRLLNLSCGLTRADDTLPCRFTHESFLSGNSAVHVPDLPNTAFKFNRRLFMKGLTMGWDRCIRR